jgi:hypothetical protein
MRFVEVEAAVDPRTNAASDRYVRTAAAPRKDWAPVQQQKQMPRS